MQTHWSPYVAEYRASLLIGEIRPGTLPPDNSWTINNENVPWHTPCTEFYHLRQYLNEILINNICILSYENNYQQWNTSFTLQCQHWTAYDDKWTMYSLWKSWQWTFLRKRRPKNDSLGKIRYMHIRIQFYSRMPKNSLMKSSTKILAWVTHLRRRCVNAYCSRRLIRLTKERRPTFAFLDAPWRQKDYFCEHGTMDSFLDLQRSYPVDFRINKN